MKTKKFFITNIITAIIGIAAHFSLGGEWFARLFGEI